MPKYDYLVVLGYPNANPTQWKIFLSRMKLAVELYKANSIGKVIVTGGGIRTRSGRTEAHEMYYYLAGHGVPKSKIIMEWKSKNTMENAYFIRHMIRKGSSALVVSSDFTIPRASYIFRKFYLGRCRLSFAGAKTEGRILGKAKWFEEASFRYARKLLRGINPGSSRRKIEKVLAEKRKNQKTPEMEKRSWY
ncbi:MAG: YdcF family protein [Candidatus Micrarchaeaceae archaeon]